MKHITRVLVVAALAVAFTPPTQASTSPPPNAERRSPSQSFVIDQTPDFDLGLQMFCTAPDPSPTAFQLFTCEDAIAAHQLVVRPDDAPEAQQPLLAAVLTRREASSIRKAPWLLYRYRPADPASA